MAQGHLVEVQEQKAEGLKESTLAKYKFGRPLWVRPEAYSAVKELCKEKNELFVDCASEVLMAGLGALTGRALAGVSAPVVKARRDGRVFIVMHGGKTLIVNREKLYELVEREGLVVELEEQA